MVGELLIELDRPHYRASDSEPGRSVGADGAAIGVGPAVFYDRAETVRIEHVVPDDWQEAVAGARGDHPGSGARNSVPVSYPGFHRSSMK